MFNIGIWLIVLGGGSFLLNHMGYEFKLLMWIDHWGSSTGDLIRIGCVVAGIVMCVLSALRSMNAQTE